MKKPSELSVEKMLSLARSDGDLSSLCDYYRGYLMVIARVQIGQLLQGKVAPSDVVQETFMQAHKGFAAFRGNTEHELLAWLRQILAHTMANIVRRYVGTRARDVRLERQLQDSIDDTSFTVERGLASQLPSPSEQAVRQEQTIALTNAIERLSDEHREVVLRHHLHQESFSQIAQHMNRSTDAVKKLWARALTKLRTSDVLEK